MYGIRYIVIAIGDLKDKATDEDCETLKELVESLTAPYPLTLTVLSESVSNKVTLALLQERGVL